MSGEAALALEKRKGYSASFHRKMRKPRKWLRRKYREGDKQS